jgi:hypothetical protein
LEVRRGGFFPKLNRIFDLYSADANPWREFRRSVAVPWRVVFTILSATVSVIALAHLIAYVKIYGPLVSVPQVCLAIATVANIFRTIYNALDPVYLGVAFTGPGAHMTSTISIPANIIMTLLIAFYWAELLDSSKVKVTAFLSKMKIPFILISIVVTVFEIASSGARAALLPNVDFIATITVILYLIITVAMTIFFIITGTRVLLYIRSSSAMVSLREKDKAASTRLIKKAAILMVTACVFNIVWVIGLLFAAAPSIFWTPQGQYSA